MTDERDPLEGMVSAEQFITLVRTASANLVDVPSNARVGEISTVEKKKLLNELCDRVEISSKKLKEMTMPEQSFHLMFSAEKPWGDNAILVIVSQGKKCIIDSCVTSYEGATTLVIDDALLAPERDIF